MDFQRLSVSWSVNYHIIAVISLGYHREINTGDSPNLSRTVTVMVLARSFTLMASRSLLWLLGIKTIPYLADSICFIWYRFEFLLEFVFLRFLFSDFCRFKFASSGCCRWITIQWIAQRVSGSYTEHLKTSERCDDHRITNDNR